MNRHVLDVFDLRNHEDFQVEANSVVQEPYPKIGAVLRPERLRVSTSLVRDKKTGEIYVDVFKRFAKPYWLTTEPKIITLSDTPNPNGDVRGPFPMPIDRQGPVEIDYSYFKSDGDFTIQIMDPSGRPTLMNREIHIRTIAGGFNDLGLGGPAGRPLVWPEPWFFSTEEGKRNFMVGFRDLSGLEENNIRFVLHGRRFYFQHSPPAVVDRYDEYVKNRPLTMPYFWTTNEFCKIPPSGPDSEFDFHIRITDEADTIIWKLTSVFDFPYEFKIIEDSQGRELMTDFVRVENGFGTAEFPFFLFEPTYFEAGTKLIFRVRNVSVQETPNTIWPTFVSQKIFRAKPERPIGVR